MIDSAYPLVSPVGEYQSAIGVDFSISHSVLIGAYFDVLTVLDWKNFVYLYEQSESLCYLEQYFNGKSLKTSDINMKIVRFDPMKPFRDVFWSLKLSNIKYILLDVQYDNLRTVLSHAQQVSMMTEAHSYLIVCLNAQTIDLEEFKYSRSRIVWLSLNNLAKDILNSLRSSGLPPDQLRTESALTHDAVQTMAYTLQTLAGTDGQYLDLFVQASCKNSTPWRYGSSIVNHIRSSIELLDGMTGRVKFDSVGQRSNMVLGLNRLTQDGPKSIGNWTQPLMPGLSNESVQIDKQELSYLKRGDPTIYASEERDLLVVVSIRNEPYFMNKQTIKSEKGNARYEGYAIDLIDELSRLVDFDYVFKEVEDGKYGKYDEQSGEWNGMIHEVMNGKADLAIADLSITSSREDAVDFTLPFMSTGISILFKKATTKELELFSILSPFETHVWVYVCGAYVGVSLLLFVVGRISPYEWADPHPCHHQYKILHNQFSMRNSFWFTISAVMQQGSDMAPRSLSTRLVAATWYFFTLIMISSYTANLAAFLSVEKVVYPIERAEDLYQNGQGIKYGCVESGSTGAFFQNAKPRSTLHKMYADMLLKPNNEEGKAEVERGNYAFFMESTSIEYTVERNCNLTQIGSLLDTKGYGIALAKNSSRSRDYRTKLSEAILSLQESGALRVLKSRWWKERRGGGACDTDDQGAEGVKELTLANVGGVFVVLGMGITSSLVLCGLELYAKSRRLAAASGHSKSHQLGRRIRFALSLSDNY